MSLGPLKWAYKDKATLSHNCLLVQVVSIWHSHLSSLVEQMVASHRKEAEQEAELSPRPSFPGKSATGGRGHHLGEHW